MKPSSDYFLQQRRLFWRKILLLTAVIALAAVSLAFFILASVATAVTVEPPRAAETAKLRSSGGGFAIGNKVYFVGSKVRLLVSADGFISRTIELHRGTSERNIRVVLQEAPVLIAATVSPGDAGTRWLLDGVPVAEGGRLKTAAEPGTHTLVVSHPYYHSQSVPLVLKRGEKKTLALKLEMVSGDITVHSEPQGATVTVNGELVGITPVSVSRHGGAYQLEISGEDFEKVTDQIEVTADNPVVQRNYRLSHKKAYISLSLSPPGGRLLINGKVMAPVFPLEVASLRDLAISYSKAGYSTGTLKKNLKPGQSVASSITLSPEFGEVRIDAEPAAEIMLNGKPQGRTPRTFTLRTVPHQVMLSKAGYRSATVKFQPAGDHVTKIVRRLQTELEARLAVSPRRKMNSIGIELLLFNPLESRMPFTMGAPRSEQGQRANEFLRTVRLSKPFYVSSKEISVAQYGQYQPRTAASALPVTGITWDEAARFCNWLSDKEKLPTFYIISNGRVTGFDPASDGYRLLSEAEWEWLARYAGRTGSARFVWGNTSVIPKRAANIADESAAGSNIEFYVPDYNDGYAQTAPVGSMPPDVAGLYDMAGNVSEWVHDVYTLDWPRDSLSDPLGVQRGSEHVVKGSSWRSGTLSSLRSAFREGLSGKREDIGFRIGRYIYAAAGIE